MSESIRLLVECPLSTEQVIDKIILFTEELCNTRFYAYQAIFARRITESVLIQDAAVMTGLWARQSGKSTTVSEICSGLLIILPCLARAFPDDRRFLPFRNGFWIGVYAPIAQQAAIPFGKIRNIIEGELATEIMQDEDVDVALTVNRAEVLGFSNGSRLMCRSASPDTKVEGDTHHLIILEEAQLISRYKVDKEIMPMVT